MRIENYRVLQALQVTWDNLPQGPINKAVKNFTKRLNVCVKAGGGHLIGKLFIVWMTIFCKKSASVRNCVFTLQENISVAVL